MGSFQLSSVLVLLASSASGLTTYECTDTTGSVIPIEIPTPGHRIAITSPNYPNAFDLTRLNCKWSIKALHGAQVRVQLVDSDLNDGCFDNILEVVDDTPSNGRSRLKYPGKSAKCGQNSFGGIDKAYTIKAEKTVSVSFMSMKNNGSAIFKLEVTAVMPSSCPATKPSGCPDGPCCAGPDCCIIKTGKEAREISIPDGSTPGLDCQFSLQASLGAQIAVNFLEMDIRADVNQACLTDYVMLQDPVKSASSLIGDEGATFCGQRLPNYPGPSVIISGGNSMVVKYHTDKSTAKKGTGFKATVAAINPICNVMNFEYKYGQEICNSSCGVPYVPTRDERSSVKPEVITTPSPTTITTSPTRTINETCEEYDVDYLGNDIECLTNSSTSWEGCAKMCNADETCTHWTWLSQDFDTADLVHACCKKTSDAGRVNATGAVSGSKACGACEEIDIDLAGDDIEAVYNVSTWEQCSHICKQSQECSFWTWVGEDYMLDPSILQKCHLKNGDSGRTPTTGLISGSSDCGEWTPRVTTTPMPETTGPVTTEPQTEEIPTEGIKCAVLAMTVQVINAHTGGPLPRATMQIKTRRVSKDQQIPVIKATHITDANGEVTEIGTMYGTYSFAVHMANGSDIFRTRVDETIDNATCTNEACTECSVHLKLKAEKEEQEIEKEECTCKGQITLVNELTLLPIAGACVSYTVQEPCQQRNTDLAGDDIDSVLDVESWQSCSELCSQNSDCTFWTWVDDGYKRNPSIIHKCHLKNGDSGRAEIANLISGPAGCQPPVPETTLATATDDVTGAVTEEVSVAETEARTGAVTDTITDAVTEYVTEAVTIAVTEATRVLELPPLSRSIIPMAINRAANESNCKDDWCKFEPTGSLFRYFETKTTWADARETCHAFSAHLASIPSMNVNKFISEKLPKPDDGGYWIGGKRDGKDWAWGDESPWNYANWADGEPNGDGICVELGDDGSFNDVPCNILRRFVCKKKDVPDLPTCQLRTDVNGKVDIDTYRVGKYVLTVNHDEYKTHVFTTQQIGGINEGNCSECNIAVKFTMTKPFCYGNATDMDSNPVNLKITVLNSATNEAIESVQLATYINGASKRTLTITNENGTSLVPVTGDGIYTIEANANDMEPYTITKDIFCDPDNCGNCKPVAALYMSPAVPESTIAPTEETCTKEIENSLTVLAFDNSNGSPLPSAAISILYNGAFIANNIGLSNSSYKTEITENGLYIVNGSAIGYVSKENQLTVNCGSCQEIDTDLMGDDFKAVLNVASWDECSSLCREEEGCSHWTWVDDSFTRDTSIIHKCHLKNGSGRQKTEAGLISGSADCDKTNCHDCINVINLYLEPDVCTETDFTVSVFEAESRTPIRGATVRINDVSESSPQVISNHLVCPTSDIEPCGWNGISEEECGKKGCCSKTETCEFVDTDFSGNDITSLTNTTVEECAEACSNMEECLQWTWLGDNFEDKGRTYFCYLKDKVGTGKSFIGLVSGNSGCAPFSPEHMCFKKVETRPMLTDSNGMVIAPSPGEAKLKIEVEKEGYEIMNGTVAVFCQHPCDSCNPSFTVTINQKFCEGSDIIDMQISVAGEACEEIDMDFMGDDIKAVLDVASWDDCSSLCRQESGCSSWTWVDDSFTRDPSIIHKCHLKNGNSRKINEAGLISGLAECEKKASIISEAKVTMRLTSSAAGATSSNNSIVMITDKTGLVSPPVFLSGNYMISVAAEGYVEKSKEITVDNSMACEQQHIPVKITLKKLREEPHCDKSVITVTVFDEATNLGLSGSNVTITSDNEVIASVETDALGLVIIPVSENGVYIITVAKEGFGEKSTSKSITYPDYCSANSTIYIKEKTCPSTIMPIVILNNVTLTPIPDALVRVIITKSKAGSSITPVDKPKYTNENGTVYFNTPMNGEYVVGVTVDGYDPIEVTENVMCDTDNCAGCAPVVTVHITPTYCQEKSLTLIIMDCKTNSRVANATVITTIDTTRGQITGGSIITSESGEIFIPITENGIYNSIISMNGYVPMRNSFEVAITMDDCDAFDPIDTVAICPPAEPGCTEVSLSWTNTIDIDLEAFRVNIKDKNETCSTKPSCCDGCKKEECFGVTPSIDTSEGLLGTETITYCNTSDYSNMIYVSDPTGEGKYLPNSGAKLVITNGENELIVRINASTQAKDSKYWLAGCLQTEATSFNFINLNKFTEDKPEIVDPLYCYDRANIEKKTKEDVPIENAKITINIFDAETKEPIYGAIAEASSVKESISRVSNQAGVASIKVTKNGEYNIEASARGYVGSKASIMLDCESNTSCENTVAFSLLPAGPTDKIEIVLNWGANANDLDLHTMQINKENPGAGCETYFNKKSSCENTELDGNKFNGGSDGGEKITIKSPAENLKYTYMVFVKDNSADTDQLEASDAHIDISDGTKSVTKTLPKFTSSTPGGANFWFVGCLQVAGESYEFAAVDSLSRDSPYITEKLYCDNLFKKDSLAGQEKPTQFCDGINLKIRLQSDQTSAFSSSLSGCGANCTTVQVTSVGKDEQKTIFEGTPDVDTVSIPIASNGQYLVKVDGRGYVATEQAFDVNCDIDKCRSCRPSFALSVSPEIAPDQAKIMLSWANAPNAIQIFSFEKDIAVEPCQEMNTDLAGDDIDSILDVESWGKCSELCSQNTDCTFWTWVDDGFTRPSIIHKCHLKNGDSGRAKLDNLVSGPVGCQPLAVEKDIEVQEPPTKIATESSISLNSVSTFMQGKVGMIFVENLSVFPKFSVESNVRVTITDGVTTGTSPMDLTNYGGENFWIAGCYKLDNGRISFSPETSFLNSRPDLEVPDYCLRYYGA